MKKMMLLLASLVALTACSQSKQDTKESTSNQTMKETKVSESSKEEKGLKFVVAPQYEGKTSELIELGKKLVKDHPELGSEGNMALYFTGAISEGRAALMLVNKTDVDIKKDLNFSISLVSQLRGLMIARLFLRIKRLAISSKIVVNYPLIQQL